MTQLQRAKVLAGDPTECRRVARAIKRAATIGDAAYQLRIGRRTLTRWLETNEVLRGMVGRS